MTLREVRGPSELIYKDREKLTQTQWAQKLGLSGGTIHSAVSRANARREPKPKFPNHPHTGLLQLTPVADFPKIIDGLSQMGKGRSDLKWHPWADDIDTSVDFQVTAPSGSTFIYEYPHNNIVFRLWRRVTQHSES